jgi:hypothetical protein
MSDKRQHERHTLWFPVTVDAATGQIWAVCKDVSVGGILISGVQGLSVGDDVTVVFRVTPDAPERRIAGRIVRVEPPDPNVRQVWMHGMAVEFREPDPTLVALFEKAATMPPPPPSSRG